MWELEPNSELLATLTGEAGSTWLFFLPFHGSVRVLLNPEALSSFTFDIWLSDQTQTSVLMLLTDPMYQCNEWLDCQLCYLDIIKERCSVIQYFASRLVLHVPSIDHPNSNNRNRFYLMIYYTLKQYYWLATLLFCLLQAEQKPWPSKLQFSQSRHCSYTWHTEILIKLLAE